MKDAFPRSRPLKKRPVDSSLFVPKKATKKAPPTKSLEPEIEQHSIQGGQNAYTFAGRPLALTDTRSVIQAAMRALLHSQQPAVLPTSMGVRNSLGMQSSNPLLNPHLAAMNINAFQALQAAQHRRSDS
jgi:hypothetical protein